MQVNLVAQERYRSMGACMEGVSIRSFRCCELVSCVCCFEAASRMLKAVWAWQRKLPASRCINGPYSGKCFASMHASPLSRFSVDWVVVLHAQVLGSLGLQAWELHSHW